MSVIVQYIVVRNGEQLMTFPTKKEADAYDKMLDTADELGGLLRQGELDLQEPQIEAIALYLAKNGDEAVKILKGAKTKPKPTAAKNEPGAEKPPARRKKTETEESE